MSIVLASGITNEIRDRASKNGKHFTKHNLNSAGANYRYVQLFNQSGSGVTVYIYSLKLMSQDAVAGGFLLRIAEYNTVFAGSDGGGKNKLFGGSDGVALHHNANNASLLGTMKIQRYNCVQYQFYEFVQGAPLVLPENTGIVMCNATTVGQGIHAEFQYEEV